MNNIMPVSYTHLDVYKRQNKHIKAIEGLYGAEQEKTAGEYATKIRELLKPLIPVQYTENPISVSYTHLDVYKRQVSGRGNRISSSCI